MKLIFSLLTLFLTVSFFLFHANSYTKAIIKNETKLSIVEEEKALIAITYGKGKKFTIVNNTDKTIEIGSVELINEPDHKINSNEGTDSKFIKPKEMKEYVITGDPKDLPGKLINVEVHWDGGSAEIKSTIPELKGEE